MSDSRSPAVTVLVNGVPIPGIIDIEVLNNNHLAANRFRVTASLTASGYTAWSAVPLIIEIRVGMAGGWTSLIYGEVDRIDFDLGRREVHVDGRDMTARFIEARSEESFENRTASDVATILAARHGLTAAVTPTTAIIGRDFQNGFTRSTLSQHARATTEWDLLVGLAEDEGFDVWMDGQTLYFAPPNQSLPPLVLTPYTCVSLRLQRLLTLSGGIEVNVNSWDCRAQKGISQLASNAAEGPARRRYSIVRPNLTAAVAQTEAQRLLTQMSQHERSVYIEMPGDLTTKPRATLSLIETGTDFDGNWTVTGVERRLSGHHGFTQILEARTPVWTTS